MKIKDGFNTIDAWYNSKKELKIIKIKYFFIGAITVGLVLYIFGWRI